MSHQPYPEESVPGAFSFEAAHGNDLGSPPRPPEEDAAAAVETVESEISRLTWLVLDGHATGEQRRRLAILVSAQHQRRNKQVNYSHDSA